MAENEQIIIIKKKGGHGGHHGGAWKVAYADFVTAMMALFIVLWLMNSSKPVQEAVGGYFRDPNGTTSKKGSRINGTGDANGAKKEDMDKVKEEMTHAMEKMPNFDKLKNRIEMAITPDGLKIELMEDPNGTFFENGRAQPTPTLVNILKVLSSVAGKLPNPISIEGHTDSNPFSDSTMYSNWELSTDRANAARRLMQSNGLRADQVVQVRGYADRNLRKPEKPTDSSNRRITVLIQSMAKAVEDPAVFGKGPLPVEKLAGAAGSPKVAKPSASEKSPGEEK